jgi:hypothetical protein
VLVVGDASQIPRSAGAVRNGPLAIIGPRGQHAPAAVAIDTGIAGIHVNGTALRMDDVALRLRPSSVIAVSTRRKSFGLSGPVLAMSQLRIRGGTVYDPANGIDGVERDICIDNGTIVDSVPAPAAVIDARGMVVMPGGVDIHSHVASAA